jgi:Protein of unknown function (DUF3592)
MRLYFALLTIGFIGAAAWLFMQRWTVARRGVRANGKVVDFEARTDDESVHYFPVVVFADCEGRTYRFTSVAGGAQRRPPLGSRVAVRYLSERPDQAFIVSFLHLWAAPLGLFALGLGALLGYSSW